ncbi:hypothetical protein TNCV_19471 [Trichonephila clavipes]|nr:hypothetical protein TNCV_19471 [Trichonephila clavipes]
MHDPIQAPPGTTRQAGLHRVRAGKEAEGRAGLLEQSGHSDPTLTVQRSPKVQNPTPSARFPREQSVVSSY